MRYMIMFDAERLSQSICLSQKRRFQHFVWPSGEFSSKKISVSRSLWQTTERMWTKRELLVGKYQYHQLSERIQFHRTLSPFLAVRYTRVLIAHVHYNVHFAFAIEMMMLLLLCVCSIVVCFVSSFPQIFA